MSDIYLIKFGGNALDGAAGLAKLAGEVAVLQQGGTQIVLVHGGGPEISAAMKEKGLKPQKVAGVRITDAAGLEVAEGVLRQINSSVVAALEQAGVRAVGLPGYFCSECRRKPPYQTVVDGKPVIVDLGLVGEVIKVDTDLFTELLAQQIVPVVYPIGAEGMQHLNVNADTMAAGLAAGLHCREMIAVTDVPGILTDVRDPASKLDRITLEDIDPLIADGTISGGMVPKVEACRKALEAGAEAVRMVNGRSPDSIVVDAVKGALRGTLIVK
ncbi:MAG: acetylglutamate kinase [Candidatus Methanomethylophilus sp.]|nr:acetylglutamate kinase [Methanomethylophilus sp.]MDD4222191.1 acetylglutamate kinase [Methanomethylophilus sp.]MDD4668515.1 acetylglutamate kinase [Methanomethylophilus sp.]